MCLPWDGLRSHLSIKLAESLLRSQGLGFVFAFALTRTEMPFKRFSFGFMAILPMVTPALHAMSCDHIFYLGAPDAITELLQIQNFQCIRDSQPDRRTVDHAVPIAYLTLTGILESIDDSVEGCGVQSWALPGTHFFRTVTLPLALLAFARAPAHYLCAVEKIDFVKSFFCDRRKVQHTGGRCLSEGHQYCLDTQGRNPGPWYVTACINRFCDP